MNMDKYQTDSFAESARDYYTRRGIEKKTEPAAMPESVKRYLNSENNPTVVLTIESTKAKVKVTGHEEIIAKLFTFSSVEKTQVCLCFYLDGEIMVEYNRTRGGVTEIIYVCPRHTAMPVRNCRTALIAWLLKKSQIGKIIIDKSGD